MVQKTLNERITEDLVRAAMKENKKLLPDVTIYEQKTDNPIIEKLLKTASKQLGGGKGKPEFIITFHDMPDLLIVIECKADSKKHESKERNRFSEYAVDGVLLYSSYLSKEYSVIAIAVSGETETDLRISTFLQLRGSEVARNLNIKKILTFEDYIHAFRKDPQKEAMDISNLMKYSRKLHNDLRDFAKLSEAEKPLLVSAILIALDDASFVSSYPKKSKAIDLARLLLQTIKERLEHAKIPSMKIQNMMQPYTFIEVHPELTKDTDAKGNKVKLLYDLIKEIEQNVKPIIEDHTHYDILGQFYGEFLRYTGGDKKGLGIVLTPRHVTELFADLADVKKDDVVLDNCCGTGGFLISAMKIMIEDTQGDSRAIKKIKEHGLVGIEQQPNMFALGCANMILRGDGKANIYRDNCFSIVKTIKENHKCTVGLLNPPYAQKGEGLSELDFVSNCLDCLEKNSICIAIVPISCATSPSEQKRKLLGNHTLEAVMSMPNDLFYPVGVVTCVMVFRAKVPHNSNRATWFGYWRDDGFVKTKNDGRIDKFGKWREIKAKWLDMYFDRRELVGQSVLHKITTDDEWCAEAYLETDYSKITKEDFIKEMRKYILFKIANEGNNDDS